MIQERSYSSAIILEKSSFQNIWKKKIWFFVQCDNESNFENLLDKNKEITIHQRNLQVSMIEIFKIINGYAPPIMDKFLIFRENTHNLRNFQIILNENKTVRYGLETISYRAPLLWANLPEEYKLADSLSEFKSKIKTWKCDTCVCRLCRPFLPSESRFQSGDTASNN